MSRARRVALVAVASLIVPLLYTGGPVQAEPTCASSDHPGGEWRTYGQSLTHHRDQADEDQIGVDNVADLEPAWTFSVADAEGSGTFEHTPVVADGCVYVTTQTGSVFALNAETGELVWEQEFEGTTTTPAVENGQVYVTVSELSSPSMAAIDQDTGDVLWRTVVDTQQGSDITGSPVAFSLGGEDMVMTGVSCIGAEGSSGEERLACRGSYVLVDQATGSILAKGFGIPDEDFEDGFAGGGIWAAPTIDRETGFAYVGAGNPFSAREHPRTNAILKIDVDPESATFGEVVDHYKGNPDQYLPLLGFRKPVCEASGQQVAACEALDLDMAMAAVLYRDSSGRKMLGVGQSSGVFHAVEADTMALRWQAIVGAPLLGGRSGGSAYDGSDLYTIGGSPGQIWSLDKDFGATQWITTTADGIHSWNPVAHANGVVYTPNTRGLLLAYDAETGDPLLARPMALDAGDVPSGNQATGVAVARNTVYAPTNGQTGGHIVAYRVP